MRSDWQLPWDCWWSCLSVTLTGCPVTAAVPGAWTAVSSFRPPSPGLYFQASYRVFILYVFLCHSVDGFCWFGFVGPDAEAEGNVFCLASNPHCVSPPPSTVPGFEPSLCFSSTINCVFHEEFRKGKQVWITVLVPPRCCIFRVFFFFFFFPLVFFKHLCFQRRIIISAARHLSLWNRWQFPSLLLMVSKADLEKNISAFAFTATLWKGRHSLTWRPLGQKA